MKFNTDFFKVTMNNIYNSNPATRRTFLILIDCLCFPLSILFSFWIALPNEYVYYHLNSIWILYYSPFIGLPIYFLTNQYKALTRYQGSHSLYFLAVL